MLTLPQSLSRSLALKPGEGAALAWAFLYFFCLLAGYYLIRPLRDAMGIAGDVKQLQWLFTATFMVMLAAVPVYGWAVSRFPRRKLLPVVYGFFIVNLLVFFVLLRLVPEHQIVARVFFVWVSVFNLFVVSVFWSFMTDVFTPDRAERLFPVIAAGGTAGALTGPAIAGAVSLLLDPVTLLLGCAALLGVALYCIRRLTVATMDFASTPTGAQEPPALAGSVMAGFTLVIRSPFLLGICAFMLLFTMLATFLYFQQAYLVRDAFANTASRTAVFATADFATNALTLGTQLFITSRLVKHFGVAVTLALIPATLVVGFTLLALAPTLIVVLVLQVLRRAGNYVVLRPAREMLYTRLGRETRYKAKSFIDTAVYRGGDAVSAWVYAGLTSLGLGASAIATVAVPVAALWATIAFALGKNHEQRRDVPAQQENPA